VLRIAHAVSTRSALSEFPSFYAAEAATDMANFCGGGKGNDACRKREGRKKKERLDGRDVNALFV